MRHCYHGLWRELEALGELVCGYHHLLEGGFAIRSRGALDVVDKAGTRGTSHGRNGGGIRIRVMVLGVSTQEIDGVAMTEAPSEPETKGSSEADLLPLLT